MKVFNIVQRNQYKEDEDFAKYREKLEKQKKEQILVDRKRNERKASMSP